ncbi:MAG: hypothetical protein Kow00109_02310 [Acidobacteriota bacterium]
MEIAAVHPEIALPGGLVRVSFSEPVEPVGLQVRVGSSRAELLGVDSRSALARIPETSSGDVEVEAGGRRATAQIQVARVLAEDLHPVANPVVDEAGNVYVTLSGSRGEEVPFGVFLVTPAGSKQPFLGDIMNPTGLALGPDGMMYISSRHTGTIYRSTFDKQMEKFVDGLGVATGIVFDAEGRLLVGDRSGRIYRVDPQGNVEVLCELEPSVSAYHLAYGPDGYLYVTGPTLASQDAVWRIDREGNVELFFRRFGRPQGMAFDRRGRLCVAASYKGWKGIFRLDRRRRPELWISGPMLVGLAFSPDWRRLYLVDGSRLYSVAL